MHFQRLLIPLDLGPHSEALIEAASDLARPLGAELVLLHIGADDAGTAAALAELRAGLAARGLSVRARLVPAPGRVVGTIIDEARDLEADLILLGTHGRRGLARTFLGSVAEEVLRRAPVPVLTVAPAVAPSRTARLSLSEPGPAGSALAGQGAPESP